MVQHILLLLLRTSLLLTTGSLENNYQSMFVNVSCSGWPTGGYMRWRKKWPEMVYAQQQQPTPDYTTNDNIMMSSRVKKGLRMDAGRPLVRTDGWAARLHTRLFTGELKRG